MTLRILVGTGLAGSFSATGGSYGKYAGDDDSLISVRYKPAGPGVVGDATFTIRKVAGSGVVIKPKMQVFIGEFVNPNWTRRYFAGFVKQVRSTTVRGTTLRDITVDCADMNLLADWLRVRAQGPGVTDSGVFTLDDQITNICRVATYNSYVTGPTFDSTTGQALTGTMTTDRKYFSYQAKTLRDMFNDRMAAYQETFPDTRPSWYFGLDATTGSTFDSRSVQLNTYDEALIGGATVSYTFSTAVLGDVVTFDRNVEGIDLQTEVQSMTDRGTSGIYTHTEPTDQGNIADYPNDYDQRPFGPLGVARKAWTGPVRKLADGSDTASVDADAVAALAAKRNPRETLSIITRKASAGSDPTGTPIFPRPGQVITFTDANESLSAYRYRIAQVDTTWEPRIGGNWWPVHNITAGNKWLELGTSDEGGTSPVYYPNVLDPPTSLSDPPTQTWDQYSGHVNVGFTWSASLNRRVAGYQGYFTNGDFRGRVYIAGRATENISIKMDPGLASTLYLVATDGQGGYSSPTATVSFTTMARGQITDTTYLGDGLVTAKKLATTISLASGQKIVTSGAVTPGEYDLSDQDDTVIGRIFGSGTNGGGNQTVNVLGTGTAKIRVASGGFLELVATSGVNVLNTLGVSAPAYLNAAQYIAVATVTAGTTTLDDTYQVVLCNATGGSITLNLPAASTHAGLTYAVIKTDSSGNSVTVDANASELINGQATWSTSVQWTKIRIVCNGSAWFIIG